MRDYVLWWITHPRPGSTFEARTRWLRWLPGTLLLRVLSGLGYDGLLYPIADAIIGHVFFQRRGHAVHGFSTAVGAAVGGTGFSVVMMLDYLAHAAQLPSVRMARVGTGRNNVTQRLLTRIKKHEGPLGWRVSAEIKPRTPLADAPPLARARLREWVSRLGRRR